jgi:peptide chain release factor 1
VKVLRRLHRFAFPHGFRSPHREEADRFRELDAEIGSAGLYDDPRRARELLREHTRLKSCSQIWDLLHKTQADLRDNQELAKGEDAEMAEMAQAEIPELEKRLADTERAIQFSLLPPDPNEDRDAIVEVRAGTGGSEAALFAADLYRCTRATRKQPG